MNACPGTEWDYWEDNLTADRLMSMLDYWNDNPPVHILVAAFVGYKPKSKEEPVYDDISQLMAMYPNDGPPQF